jgi:hypothetical protein
MRILGGAFLALLVATGLLAQGRMGSSGAAPRTTGGFGSVVFPGGTPVTTGAQRGFGSVVFPGGGGPQPNRGTGTGLLGGSLPRNRNSLFYYAYPIYVGGYYDSSYLNPAEQPAAQAPPQNITVIYPPAPASGQAPAPMMLYPSGGGDAQTPDQMAEEFASPQSEQPYYLLAFKDHTIYSTVAYWVDGDAIHYFTAGNRHNQASVSLIDRDLTERLNRESGVTVKLPAEK